MTGGFFRNVMSTLLLITLMSSLSEPAVAGEHFLRVPRATQIPGEFSTSIPLYVKGNVPPGSAPWSEAQLEDLGRKLAELNSTNRQKFGVLLLEDFDDESFQVENEHFSGTYSAVDAAIDTGLSNHPDYMREDWAWLTICFQQSRELGGKRPYTYYASKQLKEWRLGVGDIWEGDLNQFMLTRLQSRHIKDAVLDTVVEVNRRLENSIQAEENRKAELKRQGLAAVSNAEQKYALLLANIATLKQAFPGRTGDVFFPDLSAVSANLESAKAQLAAEDYAAARAAGDRVVEFAAHHQQYLDEYPATPEALKGLQNRLQVLQTHDFFDAAYDQSTDAEKTIGAAQKAFEFGSVEFLTLRNQAQQLVDEAESSANAAQSRYRAFVAMMAALVLLILTATALVLFLLRRWSKTALTSFETLLNTRQKMLAEKRAALRALQVKKVAVIGASKAESETGSAGKNDEPNLTERDVDEAGTLVGSVFIMLSCADDVLERAVKMATPSNPLQKLIYAFSASPFKAAEAYLSSTPVTFDQQSGLRFALDDTKDIPAARALWKDISEFDDFEMSFLQLNDVIAEKSRRADMLLDSIKKAKDGIGPLLNGFVATLHGSDAEDTGSLDARYSAAIGIWQQEIELEAKSYSEQLIPAFDSEITRLTALGATDPVRAYQESEPLRIRVQAAVSAVSQIEAVAASHETIATVASALQSYHIAADWIRNRVAATLHVCDDHLKQIAKGKSWETLHAANEIDSLKKQAGEAAETAENLRTYLDAGIAEAIERLRSTRISIAASIGINPEQILVEHDERNNCSLNPDTYFTSATRFAAVCAEELGTGDVTAAGKTWERGMQSMKEGIFLIANTEGAHINYPGRVRNIVEKGRELKGEVASHEEILLGIMEEFADEVLQLHDSDNPAADENGTIEDNFREIETAVELRQRNLSDARNRWEEGRLLAAIELVAAAKAANAFIQNRLEGVARKRVRLDQAVARNERLRTQLKRQTDELGKATADPRVMKPTTGKYDAAVKSLKRALELFDAERPNPLLIEADLLSVQEAYRVVTGQIQSDLELYAEAGSSLKTADSLLSRATGAARAVVGMSDDIPDSDRLKQIPGQMRVLEKQLASARELFSKESGDWNRVNQLADDVAADAEKLRGIINSEAEDGQSAVRAVSSSSRKVHEAFSWTGSYGVSVSGRPGSGLLQQARSALERGNYAEARRLAASAHSKAESAIAFAVAEVARKRREEEDRQRRERERRQREEAARRRRMQSSSSSSSFGGFRSSGGSSGFGGFRSSGGTSGW